MTIAILTAITDHFDTLKELPAQDVEVEAVCVTDDPHLYSETWKIVHEPRNGVHPNRAAKPPKMCPWRYTDADYTIWLDASARVLSSSFVSDMVGYANPIGQFRHWDRDCIYVEGEYSLTTPRYADEPIQPSLDYYRTTGHPDHWGLWAAGLITRKRTPEVVAFGEAWLAEVNRWSFQDQISEAPMLREYGLRPTIIPGTYQQNLWCSWEASGRH